MAKKSTVDKWKMKKWLDITAPSLFDQRVIGETFAFKPEQVIGRRIEQSLSDVTGDTNMHNRRIKLLFRIDSVSGTKAKTVYLGHKIAQDYARSVVRKRTSKIYTNQDVVTKDGKRVRVKSFVITIKQVNSSRKSALRERLVSVIQHEAKNSNLNDFINDILYGRFSVKVKKNLNKTYPLRHAIVEKTELLDVAPTEETATEDAQNEEPAVPEIVEEEAPATEEQAVEEQKEEAPKAEEPVEEEKE